MKNEVAVLIRDYQRLPDDPKKTLTPSGNMMTAHMRGIWQAVWLIERGGVFVSDVTVRTSLWKKTLTVIAGEPGKRILLERIRHWKGWLCLDTFLKPAESHPRLRRFESLFRHNFGAGPHQEF